MIVTEVKDVLSYSQKVVKFLNVTDRAADVVAIKSVCSSNDTFICCNTSYGNRICYELTKVI